MRWMLIVGLMLAGCGGESLDGSEGDPRQALGEPTPENGVHHPVIIRNESGSAVTATLTYWLVRAADWGTNYGWQPALNASVAPGQSVATEVAIPPGHLAKVQLTWTSGGRLEEVYEVVKAPTDASQMLLTISGQGGALSWTE